METSAFGVNRIGFFHAMAYGIHEVIMLYRSVRLSIACTKAQDVAWKQATVWYQKLARSEATNETCHRLFVRQAELYRKKKEVGNHRSLGEYELRYWQGFHVDIAQSRLRFFDQQGRWHTAFFNPDERQQTILMQGRAVSMTLRLEEGGWMVNLLVFLSHLPN